MNKRNIKPKAGVFFIIVSCISINLFSQTENVISPSPTVSSLGKYADNNISLYTGTPSINIPLYTIKLKNLEVPISLSYNPQDIQAETIPSNIGLGWSLNAGGVITRAVRHFPDDYRQDQCNPNTDYDNGTKNSMLGEWPFCPWGYMYATSESEPMYHNGGDLAYRGTDTYDLNLEEIYNNRHVESPEDAFFRNFGIPYWNILTDTEIEESELEYTKTMSINGRTFGAVKMVVDLEPDIFFFNFNGHSGKFVFDNKNGEIKIRTIPYQDLKISYETHTDTGKLIGFKIKDQKGNEYIFKDYERTINYENIMDASTSRRITSNSSWWLTKIVTHQGEELNFSYEDEYMDELSYSLIPDQFVIASVQGLTPPGIPPATLEDLNRQGTLSRKMTYTKRIKKITGDWLSIDFTAGKSREDISPNSNAKVITGMYISHLFGQSESIKRIKKYTFQQDYFLSTQDVKYSLPVDEKGAYTKKRLRLKTIKEYGVTDNNMLPEYSFEYNYYDDNGNSMMKFPNRFTTDIDLWGYFNGADNQTLIPKLHIYPDHYDKGDLRMYSVYEKQSYNGRHFVTSFGGDREPNSQFTSTGVLNKIIYPTGGYTKYEYEPHTFLMDGEEFTGGGLRIKQIRKNDGSEREIIYNYKYIKDGSSNVTSGKLVSIPMFANLPSSYGLTDVLSTTNPIYSSEENMYKALGGFYSQPVNALGTTSGSNIGYTDVIEYMAENKTSTLINNGYVKYKYSFPAALGEENDVLNQDCDLNTNGICDGLYHTTKVHNFFMHGDDRSIAKLEYYPESSFSHLTPPNPNYDWARGHLLRQAYYTSSDKLVREELYNYQNFYPSGKTLPSKVYGIKYSSFGPSYKDWNQYNYTRAYPFRIAKYEMLTEVAKVISSKKVIDYEDDSSVFSTTTYKYGVSKHRNVKEEEVVNSDGNRFKTKFKYVDDYDFSTPPPLWLLEMKQNNISSVPIEVSNFKITEGNEQLISSTVNTYKLTEDDIIVPDKRFVHESALAELNYNESNTAWEEFLLDSGFKEKIIYDVFDERGNLLEFHDNGGIYTSYIWGYNKLYPIAKCVTSGEVPNLEVSVNNYVSEKEFYETGGTAAPNSVLKSFTQERSGLVSIAIEDLNIDNFTNDASLSIAIDILQGNNVIESLDFNFNYYANMGEWIIPLGGKQLSVSLPVGDYTIRFNASNSSFLYNGSTGMGLPNFTFDGKVGYYHLITGELVAGKFFHTSFEDDIATSPLRAYTGKYSHYGTYQMNVTVSGAGDYILEYWMYNSSQQTWERNEELISLTSSGNYSKAIGQSNKYIDEVRFYPVNAQVTTYTYEPLVGMTSMTDISGRKTTYDYDHFNRLEFVRDDKGKLIRENKYHYKN